MKRIILLLLFIIGFILLAKAVGKDPSKILSNADAKPIDEVFNPIVNNVNNTLSNLKDKKADKQKAIDKLISKIEIKKPSNREVEYDRNSYEKPNPTFKLNKEKVTRKEYSIRVSKWLDYFNSKEDFKYLDPYTNTYITDYKKIDFEHIIPLKLVNELTDNTWKNKYKNQFAYDIKVGVPASSTENRKKGAKSPSEYLPPENKDKYCYTFLLIADDYDIPLYQEDIETCKLVLEESPNDLEVINPYVE